MSEDRRRPSQYPSRRDEALRTWLSEEVHPYSRELRRRLDAAGLRPRDIRSASDLARLPLLSFEEIGDGRGWLLEPTEDLVKERADLLTKGRLAVAEVLGTHADRVRERHDLRFRPVVWAASEGPLGPVLTASSVEDLDRLAELGRRALSIVGVQADDRVLHVSPGADVAGWQLERGCIDAGVAVLRGDPADLAVAAPTIVAATPKVAAMLPGQLPESVRAVLLLASAVPDVDSLARRLERPVRCWWATTGTRAAWAACPGGTGFHTWPLAEHLEVLDDEGRVHSSPARSIEGRLVWSPVGWRGTVWLRLDLRRRVVVDPDPCRACGRTTPRVIPVTRGRAGA